MLNDARVALSANLVRIGRFSRCLPVSIASRRVSRRHPIVVIPPMAGLPDGQAGGLTEQGW